MDIVFFIFGGVVTLALFAGALVVLSFAFPTLPFVPSTKARVESLLALSGMRPGDTVVDIGSGDGRIVIACAQAGAIAHGYEINPLLVWWSRRRIRALGLGDRATIFATNFWRVDFSDYDIIFLYSIHTVMKPLELFLKPQLKKGARVVVSGATFPNWKPSHEGGGVSVYCADE
ncbi:MAG: hypothetical protein AAB416_04315 [Patescibacteria group bacterium]